MSNSKDGGPLTFEEIAKLSPEEIARYTGIVAGKNHITLTVPRTLKSDGVDYTYYQAVCSCGWSGDYKASKLAAQMDACPNTREEIEAHNLRAAENQARRQALPIIGPCQCCNKGNVRRWPTGALECDNPYCTIMGMSLDEFNPNRKPHMRADVLQLTRSQIDNLRRN